MLAEFSIIPIGSGESMGEEISKILDMVDKSGLDYKSNPMGTVVEGEWEEVMELIKKCHCEILSASPRVITTISIDDRPSKPMDRITGKIKSVEERLGREVKK
ncbi:MAG: MTH1187 family thiamine-binding protein [Thermodesulfobacteriota bacterium]